MTRQLNKFLPAIFGVVILAAGLASEAQAQATKAASGLPLPRFVTLKAKKINLRVGPGQDYAVSWLYVKSGLPVEIVQEFDNWRRIRDADGTEGWVYHSLLSGKRTGMVTAKNPHDLIDIHAKPDPASSVSAKLERGVVATVKHCDNGWCAISGRGFDGWIQQVRLWGVYPNEKVG